PSCNPPGLRPTSCLDELQDAQGRRYGFELTSNSAPGYCIRSWCSEYLGSRWGWGMVTGVLVLWRILPGVLDDQAEQRQGFLLLLDKFSRQDVELALQASRAAVNVQHVREQHEIHRAD